MLDRIEKQIIKASYRLQQKPINSMKLLILSAILWYTPIIFIFDLASLQSENSEVDFIFKYYDYGREIVFLRFFSDFANMCIGLGYLLVLLGIQLGAIYLLLKKQISNNQMTAIAILSYIKETLQLQSLVVIIQTSRIYDTYAFIIVKIAAFLFIGLQLSTGFISDTLKFTCLYKPKHKSAQCLDTVNPYLKIIIKILALIGNSIEFNDWQLKLVLTLILLFHLFLLLRLIFIKIRKRNFILESVDFIFSIAVISFIITLLLRNSISLVGSNTGFILFAITFWSIFAFDNVLRYLKKNLIEKNPDHIKNEIQALSFFTLIYEMFQKRNNNGNYLLLIGLVKDHADLCTNVECICHTILQQQGNDIQKVQNLLAQFLETILKSIKNRFQGSHADIAVLAFEVQVMQKYPKYFYEVKSKMKKQKQSLTGKYALYEIEQQSIKQLNKKNEDEKGIKNTELLIQQKKSLDCFEKIEKILFSLANFYRHNSRNQCGLNFLQVQLQPIALMLLQIQNMLEEKQNQPIILAEFAILFIFFYRCVFNLPFKTKKIIAKMEVNNRKLQNKQAKLEYFEANLYNQNGCTLMSWLDKEQIGKIAKVSKQAYKLFKYPSNESMVGVECERLLPKCFRQEHEKLVQQFINTGDLKQMSYLKSSFCSDYNQGIFQSFMRAQVTEIDGKLAICIGLIKMDAQNWMIVDSSGTIDGCAAEFYKVLGQPLKNCKVQDVFPGWHILKDQISFESKTFRTQFNPKNGISTSKSLSPQAQISKSCKSILKHNISIKVQKNKILNKIYTSVQKVSLKKNTKNTHVVEVVEETKTIIEDFQSQDENKTISKFTEMVQDNLKDNFVQTGSSVGSTGDNIFSIWKILDEVTLRFKAGDQGNFIFLKNATITISVIFIFILAAQLCQVLIYVRGTQSFAEVADADFKVSDNFHLVKIIFNQVMQVDEFCGYNFDQKNCQSVLQQTKRVQNVLQILVTKNLEGLLNQETFFKNKYFQYIFQNLTLIQNGVQYKVDVLQFINFFIRSSKEISQIIQEKGLIQEQDRSIILDLKKNWMGLKNLTQNSIELYDRIMLEELQFTFNFAIGLAVIELVFIIFYAFVQNRFFNQRDMFFNQILQLFRRISLKTSEKFFVYYSELEKIVKTKNLEIISKVDAPNIDNSSSISMNDYKAYKNYRQKILLSINCTVSIILIILMTLKMQQDNQFWKQIKNSSSNLLVAENYSLQNYFEMKAYYLIKGNTIGKDLFNKYMAQKLNRNEVDFNRNVLATNELFHQVHSQLGTQFSNILINDICKLTEALSPSQMDCKKQMTLKMMESGLLSVMAYIQRTTFQSTFDLSNPDINPKQYFHGIDYYNIDRYFAFILRMFQLTEEKQIEGILAVVDNKKSTFFIIMSFQILGVSFLLLAWIVKHRLRKRALSLAYGFILIFPVTIMKDSKFIVQSIGKVLA